jgi:bifunctional UDP-N-acetylglucosamine pyrophosphorylase/glucosamine-1-phosphate N-acetyltransferase
MVAVRGRRPVQTVVLAAGRGSRMGPLTDRVPKPMLPVAGRPLLAHVVESAVAAGATRLVVVVGYRADRVTDRLDVDPGVPVEFVTQADRRGTADAVRAAADALDDGPFAVLNGDALYDVDSLSDLYDRGPAVGSYRADRPGLYGVLRTDDAGETVTGVVEKPDDPPSDLVNAGAYVLPAAARGWLDVPESDRGERELTDVLARACRAVDVRPVAFDRWLDVGRPWELLAANEWKLGEVERSVAGEVHDDAHLRGAVVVAPGARVDAGTVVEGPAYLDRGASVGPNASVRGATYLGPEVRVGHAVEVKNSVVGRGTALAHLSYVGDSVLGEAVNLGAGTNVANLRHDDRDVRVTVDGEPTSTGRRKFGVVVGDGAKTGIDTSLNPGVTLAGGARTTPGETVFRG